MSHNIERRAKIAKDQVWEKCRSTVYACYKNDIHNTRMIESYVRDSFMSAVAVLPKVSERFKQHIIAVSSGISFPKGTSAHAAALVFADRLGEMVYDEVQTALITAQNAQNKEAAA